MAQCSSVHIPSHQYIQWLLHLYSTECYAFQRFWSSEIHVSFKMTSQWRWEKANCTWAVQAFMKGCTNCLDYFTFKTCVFSFLLRFLSWRRLHGVVSLIFSSLTFWVPVLQFLPFRWELSAWLTCGSGDLPVTGIIGSFHSKLHKHLLSGCFLLNT